MACETMACGLNSAHCLFLQIKFYWSTALPVCVCIFCYCFHSIMVIVKQLKQRLPIKPKILLFCPLEKKSADPWFLQKSALKTFLFSLGFNPCMHSSGVSQGVHKQLQGITFLSFFVSSLSITFWFPEDSPFSFIWLQFGTFFILFPCVLPTAMPPLGLAADVRGKNNRAPLMEAEGFLPSEFWPPAFSVAVVAYTITWGLTGERTRKIKNKGHGEIFALLLSITRHLSWWNTLRPHWCPCPGFGLCWVQIER